MNAKRPPTQEIDLKVRVVIWSALTGRPQKDIARSLGISKSYLSQIISGHRSGNQYVDQIEQIIDKTAS